MISNMHFSAGLASLQGCLVKLTHDPGEKALGQQAGPGPNFAHQNGLAGYRARGRLEKIGIATFTDFGLRLVASLCHLSVRPRTFKMLGMVRVIQGCGLIRGGSPMWTTQNRKRYDRSALRYPSDLTDDEWAYVEPLIPPARRGGNRRHVDVREVMNGIMYVSTTGCQWRAVPEDAAQHGA